MRKHKKEIAKYMGVIIETVHKCIGLKKNTLPSHCKAIEIYRWRCLCMSEKEADNRVIKGIEKQLIYR